MYEITNIAEGKELLYETCLNIEEEIVNEDNKECYIFFSSNGLYQEKALNEFKESIMEGRRYEWKSIAASLKKRKGIGKIIYVRDIYRKFYIYGVCKSISSIDELIAYLMGMVEGYSVTTVGISSGGYMATIVGCSLNARRAFCISGQFDLNYHLSDEDMTFLMEHNKNYVNIVDLIKRSSGVPIYYFCPINCPHDRDNYMRVKGIQNVRCFLFPDKEHAATVYPFNFPDLIYMSNEQLDKLQQNYEGKLIDKRKFLLRTMTIEGWIEFIERLLKSKMSIKSFKNLWDIKK